MVDVREIPSEFAIEVVKIEAAARNLTHQTALSSQDLREFTAS